MKPGIDFWRGFYNGRLYPLLVAVLILLGHATGYEVVFGIIMLLSVIPACLICHDLRFALMPFMCTVFIVSAKTYAPNDTGYAERYLKPAVLIPLAITAVLVIAALITFTVRNYRTANKPPRGGMLTGLLVFCAALLCNGAFNSDYTVQNLFFGFVMSVTLVLIYLLFAFFLDIDRALFEHFMYCVAMAGLLICAELVVAYFTTVQFVDGEIVKGSVVLGWGVWTTIGGMLAFLMPAHFYFAASHKHGWIGYIFGFFQYFCILLSQSRGALLVGTVILGICLLYLFFKGENRRLNRWIILGTVVVGALGVILMADKLLGLVQNFLQMGFDDNGRFALWKTGVEHFLEYPVFGSGFYDSYINEAWEMDVYPYLYHNTAVQLLGSLGVVGTLAYLYHRVLTVRLVLKKPNIGKTFLGICILGLLLFSLTDVLFFKTYPTIIYSLMLLFMDRSNSFDETVGISI